MYLVYAFGYHQYLLHSECVLIQMLYNQFVRKKPVPQVLDMLNATVLGYLRSGHIKQRTTIHAFSIFISLQGYNQCMCLLSAPLHELTSILLGYVY